MQNTAFVEPGTLLRPGPIGRLIRLVMGLLCGSGAVGSLYGFASVLRVDVGLHLSVLIGPAVAIWLLPPIVNLGWGVNWKSRPRTYFLTLCAVAAVAGFVFYGVLWGPPLGVVIFATSIYALGHLGVSFVLASLIGTPGCEMRAIPDLYGRITSRARKEHYCPGLMDPIDKWESGRN